MLIDVLLELMQIRLIDYVKHNVQRYLNSIGLFLILEYVFSSVLILTLLIIALMIVLKCVLMLLNPCIVNYSLEHVSSIAHLHSIHTYLKIPVDLIVQAATLHKTQQDHVKLHAFLHSSLMIQPIDVC